MARLPQRSLPLLAAAAVAAASSTARPFEFDNYQYSFGRRVSNFPLTPAAKAIFRSPQRLPSHAACAGVLNFIVLRGGSSLPSSPQGKTAGPRWRTAGSYSSAPAPPGSGTATKFPTVRDVESDEERSAKEEIDEVLLTREGRNSFITRVYSILSAQLAFTALVVLVFGQSPRLTAWMLGHGGLVPFLSLTLSTVAWIIICSSVRARRYSPMKWNLLALFTVGEAVSVGFISSFYELRSVISAMMATAVATLGVTMYTMMQKNPKWDLSQWGAGLASCGMIFLVYGIISLLQVSGVLPPGFLPYSEAIYSLFGASLFSIYLAYHTRLIVAGKHTRYRMNSKDYVYGAMSLYSDIINMFIYVLKLLGEDRES